MNQLLHSTTAYRLFRADAERENLAHTTLMLFPDPKLLRRFLKECAKAFFGAEEGTRTARLIDSESYADALFFPSEGGKPTVEDATSVIDESLLQPVEGDRKLFVLDCFHTAAPLVQNKLLKVLEEPPQGVYFLIGACFEHTVLPTVLSRAKKFSVPPFSEEQIAEALSRGHVGETGLREAAAASGGIYSVAEALLSGGGEEFVLAERFLAEEETEKLCRELGEKKEKRAFFAALELVLRDLMLMAAGQEAYCARKTERMRRLAREYPAGVLVSAIGYTAEAERDIQFNANAGQAAYALALRIREEKKKWQKLS